MSFGFEETQQGKSAWTVAVPTAAAPEPASLALVGVGLLGRGFIRKSRET